MKAYEIDTHLLSEQTLELVNLLWNKPDSKLWGLVETLNSLYDYHDNNSTKRKGQVNDMSKCAVCGMFLYNRIGEPASAHGTVDNGRCSGWLEPTVERVGECNDYM